MGVVERRTHAHRLASRELDGSEAAGLAIYDQVRDLIDEHDRACTATDRGRHYAASASTTAMDAPKHALLKSHVAQTIALGAGGNTRASIAASMS